MFFNNLDCPKNSHTLKVIGFSRISSDHQDEHSLRHQEALCREHLKQTLPEAAIEGNGETPVARQIVRRIFWSVIAKLLAKMRHI